LNEIQLNRAPSGQLSLSSGSETDLLTDRRWSPPSDATILN